MRRENLATVNGYERNVHGRRDRPMGQRRSDRTLSTEGGTADDEIWTPCNNPVCPTTKNVAPKKPSRRRELFSECRPRDPHTRYLCDGGCFVDVWIHTLPSAFLDIAMLFMCDKRAWL